MAIGKLVAAERRKNVNRNVNPCPVGDERISLASAITLCYHSNMNSSQRKTLLLLFSEPVPATLAWSSIESLFRAVGVKVIEGRGSRVRFELKGVIATFHRPHPQKEAKPYQVRDARRFLEQAGVKP